VSDPEVLKELKEKFPRRIVGISHDTYAYQPDEELQLKLDKILCKLDWITAPGPSGLRNGHLRMWTGAFAPVSAEAAVENMEKLVSDMANDKLPPWFMQVIQGADLLAIVKTEGKEGRKADHKLVVVPNTISKVADKAMVKEFEDVYKTELMPQQVGVGVKFAAELMALHDGITRALHDGITLMALHVHDTFVLITIDLKNA